MMNSMYTLTEKELLEVSGGEIHIDVNKLVDQLNPLKAFYDFGHDVLYPYVWKPIKGFLK